MNEKNWSARETAREAGLSHPVITEILNGFQPSAKTCKALAKVFKYPETQLLRMAGIVSEKPDVDPWVERVAHKMSRLRNGRRSAMDKLIDAMLADQDEEDAKNERNKPSRGIRPARP